jgi:hypothetical protein
MTQPGVQTMLPEPCEWFRELRAEGVMVVARAVLNPLLPLWIFLRSSTLAWDASEIWGNGMISSSSGPSLPVTCFLTWQVEVSTPFLLPVGQL